MKKMKSYDTALPYLNLPHKPTYVKVKEDINFFEFFLHIERENENCFLLESLEPGNYHSRYDVIGFSPTWIIEAQANTVIFHNKDSNVASPKTLKLEHENPYQALCEWLPKDTISRKYTGGLVGYLGYDASNFFEPILKLSPHPDFPNMMFGLYTDGLVYDSLTGEMFYFFYKKSRLDMVERWLAQAPPKCSKLKVKKIRVSCTEKQHREMVRQVLREIRAGNTFQCQIGFQEEYECEGDMLAFYQRLRQINPSPHMYYIKFNERKVIGSSPELVFRLYQKEVETFPLAGTTARGKNAKQDIQLARALLNDPKEIAEHNMLVDLHRNDIGRISRFGSVCLRHLMDTKKFSHVQHISSEISGLIAKDHNMFSGLASVFPAGTLSGAPKIESMKIIEKIEQSPRGPYGGAVGHFGFNGDCTFAIPIRTLFVSGQKAFSRASGGIVYDSIIENEYLEIQRKLSAVNKSLADFIF